MVINFADIMIHIVLILYKNKSLKRRVRKGRKRYVCEKDIEIERDTHRERGMETEMIPQW